MLLTYNCAACACSSWTSTLPRVSSWLSREAASADLARPFPLSKALLVFKSLEDSSVRKLCSTAFLSLFQPPRARLRSKYRSVRTRRTRRKVLCKPPVRDHTRQFSGRSYIAHKPRAGVLAPRIQRFQISPPSPASRCASLLLPPVVEVCTASPRTWERVTSLFDRSA